jgi:hypothetical protein
MVAPSTITTPPTSPPHHPRTRSLSPPKAHLEARLDGARAELAAERLRGARAAACNDLLLLLWAVAGALERSCGARVWQGPALTEDADAAAAYHGLAAACAPPAAADAALDACAAALDARAAAVYAHLLRAELGGGGSGGSCEGAGGASGSRSGSGRVASSGPGGSVEGGGAGAQARSRSVTKPGGGRRRAPQAGRLPYGASPAPAAAVAAALAAAGEPGLSIGAVGVTTSQFLRR